ncbi:MAG: family 1 encapsulin nanocompartment shell protein [Candidatus Microthrix parvicella]|jgi:uncharacterized linocin/CFP29 family protein|uniref:Type 1 encapsulin shell protein n=1 Tax=Candidatus Neomicrothrix parvicella RN1 TaxID=1229780 RepID=R4Z2A5_9ACTN|nr:MULTISPECIES: family 1 encapsulin nanocompartment shell protein [Microthrix]MBK7018692.1 bacteriocin family protein [Candidatus Microthrix sp.]MBL0205723.1 bacteriocin family protein [Candidatus Microthrix sp.]MBP6133613.1 bacteriocin family protein [Candidatus Microthrix sp.]MBP7853020.1 bacteriocin family protein [Candidatus Microthrix sp.]MBP7986861.1 bacteriocin family protein [Candidatus Microthrix sp.]
MNRLHRELAPISDSAWAALDAEAADNLRVFLAARRLMDFHGPTGATCLPTGRVEQVINGDVSVARLVTVEMFEFNTRFTMNRTELEALERGAIDVDFDPLREAARGIANAEDNLVFHGVEGTATRGIRTAAPHEVVPIPPDYTEYPVAVAEAVSILREAGVGGPYGLALGPRCYRGVMESTDQGGLVVDHLRTITGGPLVWAPTIDGALLLSMQGGDHHLEASFDVALGYRNHDADAVELFLTETVGFRLDGDDAAVALAHGD